MLDAGVKWGLALTGLRRMMGHMLNEARQAMLLQRVMKGGDAMTARESLAGNARRAAVLGRDIGVLAPGFADITAGTGGIDLPGRSGTFGGLMFCASGSASYTIVTGGSLSISLPRWIWPACGPAWRDDR